MEIPPGQTTREWPRQNSTERACAQTTTVATLFIAMKHWQHCDRLQGLVIFEPGQLAPRAKGPFGRQTQPHNQIRATLQWHSNDKLPRGTSPGPAPPPATHPPTYAMQNLFSETAPSGCMRGGRRQWRKPLNKCIFSGIALHRYPALSHMLQLQCSRIAFPQNTLSDQVSSAWSWTATWRRS